VTGVDLTPRSIDVARRRFEIYEERGQFLIGDGENLSFPDEGFDAVTRSACCTIRRILPCNQGGPSSLTAAREGHRDALSSVVARLLGRDYPQTRHSSSELVRHTVAEIMSRNVEFGAGESRPLVKAYTRDEARQLFCDFDEIDISVNQLTRPELRPIRENSARAGLQLAGNELRLELADKATK